MIGSRRVLGVLLAGALVGGVLGRPAEAALPREFLGCGTIVDHSLKLANNLQCTGDALRIGASGITLDLGGHRVSGDGDDVDQGINQVGDAGPLNDWVVRNGTIAGFGVGVNVVATTGVRLKNLVVASNVTEGIRVSFSNDAAVVDNIVMGNGRDGVVATTSLLDPRSTGIKIKNNRVEANGDDGIVVESADTPLVKGNSVAGNGDDGIELSNADGATLLKNKVSSNGGDGAFVAGGEAVRVIENAIGRNRFSGIVLDGSPDALVRDNSLNANHTDGLFVHADSLRPAIKRNKAHENGLHGMDVQRADANIRNNRAHRNGFLNSSTPDGDDNGLGIFAFVGSSGSGNRARGNDDPDQCVPDYLC